MTVSTTIRKNSYTLTGATTAFTFNFKILAETDLEVIRTDTVGIETVLTLTTNYTVSTGPWPTGGTVTTVTNYTDGTLTIRRLLPRTQLSDYITGDKFPAETHEAGLDRLVMISQEHDEELSRTMRLKDSSPLSNLSFPDPGAGNYLRWNAAGTALEAVSTTVNNDNYTASGLGTTRSVTSRLGDYISVKDYGAVGDGVTDDTTAILVAIAAAAAGDTVYFPPGNYFVDGAITVSVNGINLKGSGIESTIIKQNSTTANTFVFSSSQFSGVSDMKITHTGTPTAGYAVTFNKTGSSGCFFGYVNNVYIQNMWNGILIESCTETRILKVHLRGLLGTRGILYQGTGSGVLGSYRALISDVVCDTAGNGNTTIIWVVQENYAYSLVLENCTGLYGASAFAMLDTANTGASYPIWCFANDLEADHNVTTGISLAGGEGVYLSNSWVGSCSAGSGINIAAGFRGEVAITNTRIMGNFAHGVNILAGPEDVTIDGCYIGDNSTSGSGTYHGILVNSNTDNFIISNNKIGDLLGAAGNNQGYGIFINTGTSTEFVIQGNNLNGNVTAGLFDGGTGAEGIIKDNLGVAELPANATVTASPMTYTNGHRPNTIYVKGGTVSSITQGGITLATATDKTIHLEPNEAVVITYSSAPTIAQIVH